MHNLFNKPLAFIKRDFLLHLRYRLSFLLIWVSSIIAILNVYFIGKLVGLNKITVIEGYGGNYFSFAVLGLILFMFFDPALNSFSRSIGQDQLTGTLEAMLVKPTSIYTILFSLPVYSFIVAAFQALISLFIAAVFLGVSFAKINILLLVLILILSLISFVGIGIISAAFIIVFKKGDPINWVWSKAGWFFGGMFFPTNILPRPLQFISDILPITYSLRALRHVLLIESPQSVIWPDIRALFVFCLFLFPLGLISFKYALKKAKQEGSLGKY